MRKELRILGLILLIVDILALILFLGLGSNYLMKFNVHNCAKEGLYNKETSTELRNRIYDSEINNFLKEFYYLQYSVIDNTKAAISKAPHTIYIAAPPNGSSIHLPDPEIFTTLLFISVIFERVLGFTSNCVPISEIAFKLLYTDTL